MLRIMAEYNKIEPKNNRLTVTLASTQPRKTVENVSKTNYTHTLFY